QRPSPPSRRAEARDIRRRNGAPQIGTIALARFLYLGNQDHSEEARAMLSPDITPIFALLTVGFALGYAVRDIISRRRRANARHWRFLPTLSR
ncbi:MAG: hypothetical protein AAF527_11845, partial [Pseudomonadota bacterium]